MCPTRSIKGAAVTSGSFFRYNLHIPDCVLVAKNSNKDPGKRTVFKVYKVSDDGLKTTEQAFLCALLLGFKVHSQSKAKLSLQGSKHGKEPIQARLIVPLEYVDYGVCGDLILVYPKPYSIYLRYTQSNIPSA